MSGEHDWTPWMGVAGVTDMLVRRCRRTGIKDIRILPPDVTAADVASQRRAVEEGAPWDDNWSDGGGE